MRRNYVGRESRAPLISSVARLGSVYNDEGCVSVFSGMLNIYSVVPYVPCYGFTLSLKVLVVAKLIVLSKFWRWSLDVNLNIV